MSDQNIKEISAFLKKRFKCHTAILYGSRSKGNITATSDYDVVGICKHGKKTRVAKKHNGVYWDLVVYSEKELKKLSEEHASWKSGRVLFEENGFGKKLLIKVKKLAGKPHKPLPPDEINVLKVWAMKELERCRVDDVNGAYRRSELLICLIEHYFAIRKKKYSGPKDGFVWLKANDNKAYVAIEKSLLRPTDLSKLARAAKLVYQL